MLKNNNAHNRVVLKMSHVTADKLLLQLNNALKFARAFEGEDSIIYDDCLALIKQIESHNDSDSDRQFVSNIRMPSRLNVEMFKDVC